MVLIKATVRFLSWSSVQYNCVVIWWWFAFTGALSWWSYCHIMVSYCHVSHVNVTMLQCNSNNVCHIMLLNGLIQFYLTGIVVIDRNPNTFGKSRTERSAEIGHIYRTRSAVLAEHSSVCRTIVRQKNSSVRFGRNRVRSITSIVSSYCLQVLSLDFLRICFKYIFAIPFHWWSDPIRSDLPSLRFL